MKLGFILFLAVLVAVLNVTSCDHHLSHNPPAAQHHFKTAQHQVAGKGDEKTEEKYSEHKQLKKSGKSSKHDHEKSNKGEKLEEKQVKFHDDHGGKKTEQFSEVGHQSTKKVGGESRHGAKFQEGAHHKKANFKKGFNEKYHKDEFKKHDSFYSVGHKSGEFSVFGKKNQKHSTQEYAKKKANNHKKSQSDEHHGKSAKKIGGHNVDLKKGHKDSKSAKSHHENNNKWAKKSAKKGGKQYKYTIPSTILQ